MSRVANLAENYAVFVALPEAARAEIGEDLGKIGQAVLAVQRAEAPHKSGRLRDALTIAEAVELLRVRIGLSDLKGGRSGLFYAVPEEFGVAAGSKMVTRLNKRKGRTVKVGKASIFPRTTYLMTWRARPGRDFIRVGDRVNAITDALVGNFWERTLARMGDAS